MAGGISRYVCRCRSTCFLIDMELCCDTMLCSSCSANSSSSGVFLDSLVVAKQTKRSSVLSLTIIKIENLHNISNCTLTLSSSTFSTPSLSGLSSGCMVSPSPPQSSSGDYKEQNKPFNLRSLLIAEKDSCASMIFHLFNQLSLDLVSDGVILQLVFGSNAVATCRNFLSSSFCKTHILNC